MKHTIAQEEVPAEVPERRPLTGIWKGIAEREPGALRLYGEAIRRGLGEDRPHETQTIDGSPEASTNS